MSTFIVRIDESKRPDGSVEFQATAQPAERCDDGRYASFGKDHEYADIISPGKAWDVGATAGSAVARALREENA